MIRKNGSSTAVLAMLCPASTSASTHFFVRFVVAGPVAENLSTAMADEPKNQESHSQAERDVVAPETAPNVSFRVDGMHQSGENLNFS